MGELAAGMYLTMADFYQLATHHYKSDQFHGAADEILHEFIKSPVPYLSIVYLITQPILRFVSREQRWHAKHRVLLKDLHFFFHVFLVVFNFFTFLMAFTNYVCRPPAREHKDCYAYYRLPFFQWLVFFVYLSKYLQYGQTFLQIVMYRPTHPTMGKVSWLHYIKHLGDPIQFWIFTQAQSEPVWIFIMFPAFADFFINLGICCASLGYSYLPNSVTYTLKLLSVAQCFRSLYQYRNITCFMLLPRKLIGFYFSYAFMGLLPPLSGGPAQRLTRAMTWKKHKPSSRGEIKIFQFQGGRDNSYQHHTTAPVPLASCPSRPAVGFCLPPTP